MIENAHPVDRHVGQAIRARRRAIGMSQEVLADQLGLTFQQVQKYERGANRVSASKLHEIAGALDVPVACFFEGLDGRPDPAPAPDDGAMDNALEVAALWRRLKPGSRGALLAFMRTLVESETA